MQDMKHYNTVFWFIPVFLAALATIGTGLYYVVGFGWVSMVITLATTTMLTLWLSSRLSEPGSSDPDWMPDQVQHDSKLATFAALLILLIDLLALLLLATNRTTDALRSPWEVVPATYFFIFWIGSALLLLASRSKFVLPLAMLHTFVGWSVAVIVYKLGFGFDPFIHQAAEKIIAADGIVRPLTPYYIGQYVTVVTLHRLTTISLDIIDRWLLPVLASVSVPYLLFRMRRTLAPLASFLPATMFIMTTPQGLGNLWLLLTAFTLSSPLSERESRLLPFLFSLAALATHPIAGVPALALVALATTPSLPLRIRGSWRGLVLILTSLSLPAAFAFRTFTTIHFRFPKFDATALLPIIQNHFDWPLDFVYLVGKNWWIVIIILVLIGCRHARRWPHLLTAAALLVSYVLMTSVLDFPGIISYEAGIFPSRLLEVAIIVLLPLVASGVSTVLEWTARDPWTRYGGVVLIASLMTTSIYLTYPRADHYDKNQGRSVSAAMVKAVHWIEDQPHDRPYIVLVDQNAAAMQIHDFGFGPYYQKNYFYSHPSGSLGIYRYYLQIMEQGADPAATAREAMAFAGVDELYLVIPDYWKTSRKVIPVATHEANEWTAIGDEKIFIFTFSK